ncbi:phosphate regulon transcriptional regulator PhoB [Cocleimonas flava]|uniref:Two-component system phosphate regulon response regulator PhoB n=1 Tax=Cocleimonas flava TaxID=634765 RepID=A0A4R1F7G1_9GAMM|nr:response regulator [Cocleimonas flava]TCJ88602.1 two-component system phosphate regulon response regulator PhoB [Cocleimonas flava]
MFEILLVEDDHAIREMLQGFLLGKSYKVKAAESGGGAFDMLAEKNPDLILLDWMLPDISGPEIIKQIRKNKIQRDIPILMLTARAEEMDKVKGLEVGADDYMTKPVSLKELDARIKALIRRSQGLSVDKTITRKSDKGSLVINLENNSLLINDATVDIGQTEFRLLHYFMRKPERIHSRAQLLDQVWGQSTFIDERTVDVHILRLRKVLKPYELDDMLKTVRGAGYRFTEKLDG